MKIEFSPAAITRISLCDIALSSITSGKVEDFEKSLAGYFNKDSAYTFGSLMRTMYACFAALKETSGRNKVVLPRYSCPSFIHGALASGFDVVYCDIEPETLCIDMTSLTNIDMEGVIAVVCTNLFGLSSKIDKIVELCHMHGVVVIEGVDYGIGSEYLGRRLGAWGDIAILNFQEGKAIPVGGGAIVTSLETLKQKYADKRKKSRPNYITMSGFSVFSRPFMYGIFFRLSKMLNMNRKQFSMEDTIRNTCEEHDFAFNSDNYEMAVSDFQGRLGLRVFGRLEQDALVRYKNAMRISKLIGSNADVLEIKPIAEMNRIHYIRFPLLIGNARRDYYLYRLLAEGIEASPMYIEHGMNIDPKLYPGSYRVANELMTVPCHPLMKQSDFDIIADVIS